MLAAGQPETGDGVGYSYPTWQTKTHTNKKREGDGGGVREQIDRGTASCET